MAAGADVGVTVYCCDMIQDLYLKTKKKIVMMEENYNNKNKILNGLQ